MHYFASAELHISMAAEPLFHIGSFPVTNAVITGLATTIIVVALFVYVATMVKAGRYNRFVGLTQWGFEGMLGQINSVIADKALARRIAPLALTIFFFVLIGYWLSVLPGLDTIKVHDVPVLRSITADLNFTLGLALITMITVQMYAIKHMGVFGNGGRYIRNPFKDPLGAFEGALELIGEFSRGIALALRLFGNAFAGEVLLVIVAILTSYFATVTLPFFMAFELFIGLIQAYVFFVLTLIFTSLALESHTAHSPEHSSVAHAKQADALE
jgi:F-type H+-transporting ATPase subunit a